MSTWSERMRAEGHQQGILQGIMQGRQEGRQEGRREGLQEGRQEGELAVLLRQLTRRFGPLDTATRARLQAASAAELERWADNILDAQTLDEVFGAG